MSGRAKAARTNAFLTASHLRPSPFITIVGVAYNTPVSSVICWHEGTFMLLLKRELFAQNKTITCPLSFNINNGSLKFDYFY